MYHERYQQWNLALADKLLNGADERVQLTVSASLLAAAWEQQAAEYLSSEEAERQFVEAVAEFYRHYVRFSGLEVLSRQDENGVPRSVAFLALSVLAAGLMHDDGTYAAHDYYHRLSHLLGYDDVPPGFAPIAFRSLWRELRGWVGEQGHCLAGAFRPSGAHHIINMPLSQAPLRQVDLDKLPTFFSAQRWLPGESLNQTKLQRALGAWSKHLTRRGQEAWRDAQRREIILEQVRQEFAAWDGDAGEPCSKVSTAAIALHLAFDRRRQPRLSYYPRRLRTFPQVFQASHGHSLEADKEWYDAVPCEDWGVLAQGVVWDMQTPERTWRLQLRSINTQAFSPAQHQAGWLSDSCLRLGVSNTVLCQTWQAGQVEAYLRHITDTPISALPGATADWRLFGKIIPVRSVLTPLEGLEVETETKLWASGGLRVGPRHNQWLTPAPPKVFVAGLPSGATAQINGQPVPLDDTGALQDGGLLAQPGCYEVVAGRKRLRVEVVAPTLAELPALPQADARRGAWVALPPGRWTLIGARPHELTECVSIANNGFMARMPFPAVWAMRRNASAEVVCLQASPNLPAVIPNSLLMQQRWAECLLVAQAGRPRLSNLYTIAAQRVMIVWRAYLAAAQQIVMAGRKRRGQA